MVKLANGPACVVSTQVQVDVDQGDGTLVQMPENPSWQLISEQIESGKSLLVRWRWREPFCGDDFPYSVTVSLPRMGLSDTLDDVNVPGCPTDDGEPATRSARARTGTASLVRFGLICIDG